METGEVLGLIAFFLLSLGFYLLRSPLLFALLSAAIVILSAFTIRLQTAERVLFCSGLLFYIFGLLIARVILNRSVSLLLLRQLSAGHAPDVEDEIAMRLNDAPRFGLTTARNGILHLTSFGKIVATFVALFYFLTRQSR
jgi:hypothetical protein